MPALFNQFCDIFQANRLFLLLRSRICGLTSKLLYETLSTLSVINSLSSMPLASVPRSIIYSQHGKIHGKNIMPHLEIQNWEFKKKKKCLFLKIPRFPFIVFLLVSENNSKNTDKPFKGISELSNVSVTFGSSVLLIPVLLSWCTFNFSFKTISVSVSDSWQVGKEMVLKIKLSKPDWIVQIYHGTQLFLLETLIFHRNKKLFFLASQ